MPQRANLGALVAGLASPEYLVEIEAIVTVPRGQEVL
jgi:hypothetical protein